MLHLPEISKIIEEERGNHGFVLFRYSNNEKKR
jgi:hypothetical protein